MKITLSRGKLQIFTIALALIISLFIVSIAGMDKLFTSKTPVPLPTYTVKQVSTVCQMFALDNEPWCKTEINKDANTLEETLNNHFPPGKTSYSDLSTIINSYPSISSPTCPMETEFVTNNCPQPSQCHDDYSCSVSVFTGTVLYVFFDYSTGKVTKYGVSKPGES